MLFTILKAGLQGRKFYKNPGNFVEEGVKETALAFLIIPVIISLLVLILLFALGFTHFLWGPFVIAKILFWICIVGCIIIGIPVYLFYKLVKGVSHKAGETTDKLFVKSEVKENQQSSQE